MKHCRIDCGREKRKDQDRKEYILSPFKQKVPSGRSSCTVVALLLDGQLDTKIDGLLSIFRQGARGRLGHVFSLSLYLCHMHILLQRLHYINGDTALRRIKQRVTRETFFFFSHQREEKQGQSIPSYFMIPWFPLKSLMRLINTLGHPCESVTGCS